MGEGINHMCSRNIFFRTQAQEWGGGWGSNFLSFSMLSLCSLCNLLLHSSRVCSLGSVFSLFFPGGVCWGGWAIMLGYHHWCTPSISKDVPLTLWSSLPSLWGVSWLTWSWGQTCCLATQGLSEVACGPLAYTFSRDRPFNCPLPHQGRVLPLSGLRSPQQILFTFLSSF